MAAQLKEQVKGGACFHLEPCNTKKSDNHNERTWPITNLNIRLSLTNNNYVWKAPEVQNLSEYENRIYEDYQKADRVMMKNGIECHYHKKLPSKGKTKVHPLKEGILVLPSNKNETTKIVWSFVKRIEERTGWKCIRIYIHRDEYFHDPDTKEDRYNHHAHLVFDTYDWENHALLHRDKDDCKVFQDIASEETGMPRGNPSKETRVTHKNPAAYKANEERKRAEILTKQNDIMEAEIKRLENKISKLEAKSQLNTCVAFAENYKLARELSMEYDRLAAYVTPDEEDQKAREEIRAELIDIAKIHTPQDVVEHLSIIIEKTDNLIKRIRKLKNDIIREAKKTRQSSNLAKMELKFLRLFVPTKDAEEILTFQEEKKVLARGLMGALEAKCQSEKEMSKMSNKMELMSKQWEESMRNAYSEGLNKKEKEWKDWMAESHYPLAEHYNKLIIENAALRKKVLDLGGSLTTSINGSYSKGRGRSL